MKESDSSVDRNFSYIEKKISSISEKTGIQKDLLLQTPFEEIETKLGVADENISEIIRKKECIDIFIRDI